MSEGKKFDGDKARTDLLSSKALLEIARVMGEGAKKYGSQNWRKGIAWSRVYAAVQRHLLAWNDGETYDPETGINHLAHASCGLMFLLEYAQTHAKLDDRYCRPETSKINDPENSLACMKMIRKSNSTLGALGSQGDPGAPEGGRGSGSD